MFTTLLTISYNTLGDMMKVMKLEQNNVVIFLPTPFFSLDFSSKDDLEDYFRELFLKLEDHYDFNMSGFYDIEVYEDSYYGAIFTIEEEDIPYFDCLDRQVEMSIRISKEKEFLYKIEDPLDLNEEIVSASQFYQYQNEFFLKLTKKLTIASYMRLLEYSTLVYGKKVKNIQKFGHLFLFNLC